ncbi:MAG: group III truncated hemoglobin [Verrucomicrobiota bacterium]
MDAFYEKVRADSLLGFIFDEVAEVDWDSHLPKMYDFWETMIFRSGSYRGNPLRPHLGLSSKTKMGPEQFERWQSLFFETVDEHYAGEKADHIKNAAADMAQVMLSKITAFHAECRSFRVLPSRSRQIPIGK